VSEKRVAIIGGGLGGLTAAVFLQGMRSADGADTYTCDLFEASGRVGGNMWSAYFQEPYAAPFADLAVNDFNANTYTNLMQLIATLEAAGLPVPHAPLIDEDCYATARGAPGTPVSYTSDEVADPSKAPQKTYLPTLAADWARFESLAGDVISKPQYALMSVAEFVKEQDFSADFANLMLLPRINAMYFMTAGDPGAMPIRGVMFYYHLQEGLGSGKTPDRRFFVNGASQWANQLETYVRNRGTVVRVNAPASATPLAGGGLQVTWPQGSGTYDHVVCAVQPHAIKQALPQLPFILAEALKVFGAYPATALVHNDPSVMPADPTQWRTYNVLIEPPGDKTQPYTISYVNAMHNGVYAQVPPFVTENPIVPIAPGSVLDMVDLSNPTGPMVKAQADFTHNTVSVKTMALQAGLPTYQGHGGVYFTGGWTNGAGLQEQIISTSMGIAATIRGFTDEELQQTYREDRPAYVPHYLRRSLGRKPREWPAGFWPMSGAKTGDKR